MANAIGTGVNVPDFRHITHHSLFQTELESNILYVARDFNIINKYEIYHSSAMQCMHIFFRCISNHEKL